MTTDKKPRKGTIAHYRARTAELANQVANYKAGLEDANRDALRWHAAAVERDRERKAEVLRSRIATERAEQAERERDGETAIAYELARRLVCVRELLAYTRGRLSRVRISRDEYHASAKLRGRAADHWRDESATLYAELDKAKAAYASARIRCNELAGQVMAAQTMQADAEENLRCQLETNRRHVAAIIADRRNFKAAAVVAVVVALTLAAVVIYV